MYAYKDVGGRALPGASAEAVEQRREHDWRDPGGRAMQEQLPSCRGGGYTARWDCDLMAARVLAVIKDS
jgi:hypothetical protein